MTPKQYELSLEQRVQRVRDAWFSNYESDEPHSLSDSKWPRMSKRVTFSAIKE